MKKSVEEQLAELIPDREFTISTDGWGRGWMIYDGLPDGDSIFAQTIRVNSKTVKVERLYDLHREFAAGWADELWILAVEREARRIWDKIRATYPQKRGSNSDPYGERTYYKFPSGRWRDESDIWEISMNWAAQRLRKRGYDVPESSLWDY